jgi:hypothetical protein
MRKIKIRNIFLWNRELMNLEIADSTQRILYDIGRAWCDRHYDDTTHLLGKEVRGASAYAVFLCESGSSGDLQRAEGVLGAVVDQQETNKDSPYYGWYKPFSDAEVSADPNWSAFCGSFLMHSGIRFSDLLDEKVVVRIGKSVERACEAILKRNVNPGYTNIAMLSASVLTAGGRWIGSKRYVEEGRRKLRELVENLNLTGAFQEYNSPTYYAVSLSAACWMSMFAEDEEVTDLALRLESRLWHLIAKHYHPATCQLSGPHARAYGSLFQSYAAAVKYYLFRVLGDEYELGENELHGHDSSYAGLAAVQDVNCPEEALEMMCDPLGNRTVVGTVLTEGQRADEPYRGRFEQTTARLTDRFALGTVNVKDTWSQRRNLVLFWREINGTPAALTEGLWEDDEPSPPPQGARFRSVQNEGKVLAVYDFGEFGEEARSAVSVRFRCEVTQPVILLVNGEMKSGLPIRVLQGQDLLIVSGEVRIHLRYCAIDFLGDEPELFICSSESGISLEVDLYRGDPRSFTSKELSNSFFALFLHTEQADEEGAFPKLAEGDFEVSDEVGTIRWHDPDDNLELCDPIESARPWFTARINGSPVHAQRYFDADL